MIRSIVTRSVSEETICTPRLRFGFRSFAAARSIRYNAGKEGTMAAYQVVAIWWPDGWEPQTPLRRSQVRPSAGHAGGRGNAKLSASGGGGGRFEPAEHGSARGGLARAGRRRRRPAARGRDLGRGSPGRAARRSGRRRHRRRLLALPGPRFPLRERSLVTVRSWGAGPTEAPRLFEARHQREWRNWQTRWT